MLVIILVSLFPLPLDRLKWWIADKNNLERKSWPCTDINVTDVWSYSLPKLMSESTMRAVDANQDGVDDVIFGFGIGNKYLLKDLHHLHNYKLI